MTASSYDLAIIGCGPVGALAANLAAQAGLRTLVIDRDGPPHPMPRAVHLDHEMMRLFQSVGLVDRLAPLMRETQGHLHIGADHGVIRYMGTAGRVKRFGWGADYFFYQPEIEAVLRDGIATHDNVDLQLLTSLDGIDQDRDGVTLRTSSGDVATTTRASWVIACDGARSQVRKALGIELDDLDFEEPWLVVDVEADGPVRFPDLWGVPGDADLQQLSVMMCDPLRPATVVPGRGRHRRWEFMLLPGEDEQAMMRPEAVSRLLAPYLQDVPHRIVRATTYRFHGLIAEQWQSGRIFLAGDAAHQTPPFFGQGMCHGMRDVANLAWKLALVERGDAAVDLLATYQPERDPHVRAVVSAAVSAGRYICELDPSQAAARDTEMRERAKAGAAATASDLIPALDAGVVAPGTSGAGERFIQPWVRRGGDRLLLDDVTGAGWRLFNRVGVEGPELAPALAALPLSVIALDTIDDDGAIDAWLTLHGADAVIVRPDFYVFGTAGGSLDALLDELARRLLLVNDPLQLAGTDNIESETSS